MQLTETKAKEIINSFSIPPKPALLVSLQLELAKEEQDPRAYAELISQDVALSAVVLKTVNSPGFGLKRQLSDIRQAVVMLGADRLTHLVTYFALRQSIRGKSSISLEKFWDNTMEVATMSRFVLEYLANKVEVDEDALYALSLFRDCGIPLMAMKYSDYRSVLYEANHSPHHCFTEVEEGHYQTNHAIIGYFVASSWHLPKSLCELILRHHDPNFLTDNLTTVEQKDLYALMKIASAVATRYKYNITDTEWPMTSEAVLTHMGMSDIDFDEMMVDLLEGYSAQFGEF
ncbi:HDOD domain-containing protein [Methylophaga sp. OBS1]|uniref:HDOD domain-containing protein n=1 Tax=Methylophaga sp. OBS1 TaxID=2991933 RepID=UPI00225BD50A|nr:HDOD domain-containing protein [Methylophaga sp. OBS1]MCX4192344.1 HDOD domain-containing protein [Methylophaga sp. OBS1]